MHPRLASVAAVLTLLTALPATGCNSNEEPYHPQDAGVVKKPSLPPVPTLSTAPKKTGDGYTVFGAIHDLRSRIHSADVTQKEITIVGYIVDANYGNAPKCAQHPTGKKDPDNCPPAGSPPIEIPSFWIADAKGDTKGQKIRVLGWAKNWATVYDAMQKYKNLKDPPKELVKDDIWGVDVPFPLPAVGAKVKVTGHYGYTFTKSSTGLVSDPQNGVMTYDKVDVLEPAQEPAAFAQK
jgi:hypothetical protein